MRARALWMLTVLLGGAGCSTEIPEPIYAFYPKRLDIAPVSWTDNTSMFRWYSVSVLNETFFPLELRDVEIIGGEPFLELRTIETSTTLPLRESRSMEVRFAPPESGDHTRWTTGVYEAELQFEVGGSGVIDIETNEVDRTAYRSAIEVVPITFEIVCDLDGDGYDAEACNGTDCDDELAAINPAAIEACDGVDNNCALGTDEGCDPG